MSQQRSTKYEILVETARFLLFARSKKCGMETIRPVSGRCHILSYPILWRCEPGFNIPNFTLGWNIVIQLTKMLSPFQWYRYIHITIVYKYSARQVATKWANKISVWYASSYRVDQKKMFQTLRSSFREVFLGMKVIFCWWIEHPI